MVLRRDLLTFYRGKIMKTECNAKQKTKFLLSLPSNELGNTQNEALNNVFPKPLAWKVHNHLAPSLA